MALLSSAIISFAQTEGRKGEVRLKNGSVIKGTIVEENENGDMSVEMSDGTVYDYESKEIQSYKYYTRNSFRKKGYIGITAGPSIPLGDFGSELNGGAKVGLNLSLVNFGYRFSDYIGITASWFGAANPLEVFGDDSYDPWSYGGITAGPLFSFPIASNVEIDLRPMIGYSVATVPDIGDGTESSMSFAYNGSVMFRFHCSRRISILLSSDYFYTKATFDRYNFEQKISTLSINGGVAYRF